MIIGFDTLGEDPHSPTSAINYLTEFIDHFSGSKKHTIILFGSTSNRKLFTKSHNIKFVNCHFSNENVIMRILAQQIFLPIYTLLFKVDILFSPLNSTSIFSFAPVVLKVNTLHHLHFESNRKQNIKTRSIDRLRKFYRYIFFDLSIRKAELIIANTNYTKNEIIKYYNVDSKKVDVIMEASGELFGKYDKVFSKKYIKEKFNIDFKYIIYPAAFWDYKNHRGALESFHIFKRSDTSKIKMLFVGRDEEGIKKEIVDMAINYRIEKDILCIDYVNIDEVVHLINAAEILFFPSKMETFGKPIVEAMISNTPVVASNNSSIPELLSKTDYLCKPNDYKSFAKKLNFLINESDKQYINDNFKKAINFTYKNSFKHLDSSFYKVESSKKC